MISFPFVNQTNLEELLTNQGELLALAVKVLFYVVCVTAAGLRASNSRNTSVGRR